MPTYEYRCPAGHEFERFQKMTEASRARCPECGRMAQRRISGGAGLIFKGSGFYITDYGKDGKGPAKSGDAEAPAAVAGGDAAKDLSPNPEKPASPGEKPARKSGRKKASS
jgi:putative FmdB family regulatory protein